MLNPKAVALVGVSKRAGSVGRRMLQYLRQGGFQGRIYAINPRYETVQGLACYAALAELPEVPDLVIIGVGGQDVERVVEQAISLGAGGAVLFYNNYLPDDESPTLLERVKRKACRAGFPICGGNGMGFYNYDHSLFASFDVPPVRPAGHIALIAHSGSVMTYLANNDARFMFNLVVSPGQEIYATAADYLDYALDQASTRVVALFLEAVRDVDGFIAGLKKAQRRRIPVVITKVGRTEKSAKLAATHSGALAGNESAFQAVCDRYGVLRTPDLDDLMNTALLMSQGRLPASGGLAALLDSGGLREQLIDLAAENRVPLAEINDKSREIISEVLEFGLAPENPVDAMGNFSADLVGIWTQIVSALAADPDCALLAIEFEFRDDFSHYPELFEVIESLPDITGKPVFVLSSSVHNRNQDHAARLTQAGIPVMSGVSMALRAVKKSLAYRDHQAIAALNSRHESMQHADLVAVELLRAETLDEGIVLQVMARYGLPVARSIVVSSDEDALKAAVELGYPLVLKTAHPDIAHKSDRGGVHLQLQNEADVGAAYADLASRLGGRVLVAEQISGQLELSFGMVNDAQYGPVVIVAAGGILIEAMGDSQLALAPVNQDEARRMIGSLRIAPLFSGLRGRPALSIDAAADVFARFSEVMAAHADVIAECDLNPVIVGTESCTIVDGLIVRVPSGERA
jgi:acyl-CoA synthetase (NDP forming)